MIAVRTPHVDRAARPLRSHEAVIRVYDVAQRDRNDVINKAFCALGYVMEFRNVLNWRSASAAQSIQNRFERLQSNALPNASSARTVQCI